MNRKLLSGAVLGVASLGVGVATPLALAGPAGAATAATARPFHATFVDVFSQCLPKPPVAFCGHGNVAGFGPATSTVKATSPLVPIPGIDCVHATSADTVTLDQGHSSLTLGDSSILCPAIPGGSPGGPFVVAATYTITRGTGVFAGATGRGTDLTRSAGKSQVKVLYGTITVR